MKKSIIEIKERKKAQNKWPTHVTMMELMEHCKKIDKEELRKLIRNKEIRFGYTIGGMIYFDVNH